VKRVLGALVLIALVAPPRTQDDAWTALRSGRYDDAIRMARRELRGAPSAPAAQRALLTALTMVGDYETVLAEADRADRPELGVLAGDAARELGRLDVAAHRYRDALAGSDSLTARLRLAELDWRRGDVAAALERFDGFIDTYNRAAGRLLPRDLQAVGQALAYLGRSRWELLQDAVRALNEATRADPRDTEAELMLGQLFLAKSQGSEARTSFETVLARNPRHPAALVGMARLLQSAGEPGGVERAEEALEINPRYAPAHLFLAERHLEAEEYEGAAEAVDHALSANPVLLEGLTLAAAVAYLRGDSAAFVARERDVLRSNPQYAGLYETLATVSARNRLYREAEQFARRATELDSLSWRGWALLGANRLRLGLITEGRADLERAFAGDPYDVWTKNTLDLLDTLVRYDEQRSRRFLVVVDPSESALMGPLVARLAEQAYDRLADRYAFRPETPVRIEVYPDHADFSVRTVGLVGLGALGVSFGPVLAIDSPSAREVGEFHWASTLWHEIAHTFHLGLTRHRVPRWFTEGLAVWEERQARPGWGNRLTPEFLAAYHEGRLRAVSELNEGFVRPRFPMEVMFSYELASLVCEYIADQHGPEALVALLHAYRDGLKSEAALRTVLGESGEALDDAFDEYVRQRFGTTIAALDAGDEDPPATSADAERLAQRHANSFQRQVVAGRMLMEEGSVGRALPYLERARALLPEYAGPGNAYAELARAYRRLGRLDRTGEALEALVARNAGDLDAWRALGDLRVERGDTVGAIDAFEQIVYIEPLDPSIHRVTADLARGIGAWDREVPPRAAIVALDPVDRADALYRLALAHHRAGHAGEARRAVLRALEIAPDYVEAQELLLAIHEGGV